MANSDDNSDHTPPNHVQPRMTPAEAHRRLLEMERAKDVLRIANAIPAVENARVVTQRYTKHCSVTLSTNDLYRLTCRLTGQETTSSWIRETITKRLDEMDEDDRSIIRFRELHKPK